MNPADISNLLVHLEARRRGAGAPRGETPAQRQATRKQQRRQLAAAEAAARGGGDEAGEEAAEAPLAAV